MQYNNKSIVLSELIGLKARIIKHKDAKQKGMQGKVVDETKNTLVINTSKGIKRVIKANAMFRFYAGSRSFDVDGKEICFRPEERTEKAIKFYKRRSL
ncbi:MAG: ribonuclease P protein component 1 [Candidatus Micrarchaeia archaeon]